MMISKACPECNGDVFWVDTMDGYGTHEFRCLQAGHLVAVVHVNEVLAQRKAEAIKKAEEVIMTIGKTQKAGGPLHKKTLKRMGELEKDREAIEADYFGMKLADFYRKWRLTSRLWGLLKKKWEIVGKGRGYIMDQSAQEQPLGEDMSEHERYLILLGYQQAVREILGGGYNG